MHRRSRRLAFTLAALLALQALIAADMWWFVRRSLADLDAFTVESRTIFGKESPWKFWPEPDVQIAPEATPPRLLYGEEATRARERGEQVWQATVVWPYPSARGVFTPFYRTCEFGFAGWDAETDALRAEFVAALNADPFFRELPAWCRASMTSGTGRSSRIVWGLLAHDAAVCGALLASVVLSGMVACDAWWLLRRRPGHCRSCGYDLAGLAVARCPECGAGNEKAAVSVQRPRPGGT